MCLGVSGFLSARGEPASVARDSAAIIGGIFLLLGLWTPVTGGLLGIDGLWIAFSVHSSLQDGQWIHILLAVLATGIAMLGPGAWSIDARLFGRKRFYIGGRNSA